MKSEYLNLMLIENFPNLKRKYLDEISWQEGNSTGSHTIYGDVLTPYLVECIIGDNTNEIKKIFDFLEKILEMKDLYSDEVISYSVIESIVYLFKGRDFLLLYLGNNTKKVLDELTKHGMDK